MRPIQYFSDEYLERCRGMTADQVIGFLDDFRRLHGRSPSKSKLISIKIPEDLLAAFKQRASLSGTRYQSQIKKLMRRWVLEG